MEMRCARHGEGQRRDGESVMGGNLRPRLAAVADIMIQWVSRRR